MRRALLPWLVAFGLFALAAVGTVAILNATVFGAGSFVRVYLDALARGDVSDALSLSGVSAHGKDSALLHEGTLESLTDIHQLSDEQRGDTHWITVGWTTPHGSGTTTFEVERVGTRFGLFPEWGFEISPIATVSLAALHDARFTLNGRQEVSAAPGGAAVDYAVLVPGSYVFAHQSRYLVATPDVVLADTVGQKLDATVDTQANAAFVTAVSQLIDTQLAACTKETVLFPSGCSFGQAIDNRVSSTPTWSIVQEPQLRIVPGADYGTWAIPTTPATAHLVVKVTSLFDGTVTTFDQDVPFTVEADITLGEGDAITVTQR